MSLFKGRYRIETDRLKGWDYSSNGYYFVTICTKNRYPYFGEIKNVKMQLSEIGDIAKRCWNDIPDHFENVILDEYVVMPDHTHGIIVIDRAHNGRCNANGRGAINRASTTNYMATNRDFAGGITGYRNPMLTDVSLSKIIRWFKGRCSFEIRNHLKILNFRWQSRYYERIIRDRFSLDKCRKYIIENPGNHDK
ncbi:MAG: transposase [Candidatus Margulisiibacteriota bacterium]